ncbi:glutathione S-transferase family protein [Kordiimonas sp. SCSIO 12610]|uniref:glutathione S-transferase family protein n=1 Tax=Kordiimonas sp. SCSIO 12610 TaxID=2829597 RepID=UPI00210AE8E3|nr:glutathione S-transferase family protein [Kordiimonas sp. SCSIO 12610]UTW55545.1 glutathione S-transferase family protein [Kordiimonas sp. SCSIO 12610]
MGLLIDGEWHDKWYDTKSSGGRFIRSESQFRNWITADGSAGATGTDGFKAEAGRYHLYLSHACPWAHRTAIMRSLKGLEEMISVSFVSPIMLSEGWTFDVGTGSTGDPLFGFDFHHQIYTKADPKYSGRVTVPVLWDKKQNTIVSNESADIIRMLNSAFDTVGAKEGDYWPTSARDDIEAINTRVYHEVNNGVYKAGFATSQEAYEEAIYPLFEALNWLEDILEKQRYLLGSQLTEADIRLFTTLVRFDPVYFGHFKCNIRSLESYSALTGFVRDIYQIAGIADTVNMDHIKTHYYASHRTINPTGVVPVGNGFDLNAPHGRDQL